jgi:hypothetical protein
MKRCVLIPKINFKISWLKEHLQPEDTVLPLTLSTFMSLRDLLPRVSAVEEWIPYADIRRLAFRAHEINQAFSADSCQSATFEGYDWPRICWNMQDSFFRDILLAEALAFSLKKKSFEQIVWVGNPTYEPYLVSPTSNVVASTFRVCLGNRFEVLSVPYQTQFDVFVRYGLKIQNGFQLFKKKVVFSRRIDIPKCHVIAISSPPEEWMRFSEALIELHREYGENFQFWSVGRASKGLREWANTEGIRDVWVPYPDRVGKEVLGFFKEHWDKWQSGNRRRFAERVGCPAMASDELKYHFYFYFMRIWPRMAEYARVLESYLKMAEPKWLIGSTSPTTPHLFPYNVASKLGISTIAVSHGYVHMGDSRIESSFLACRNRFERAHFVRSFPDERQVLYCSNAGDELSYRVNNKRIFYGDEKKLVVILTCDPDVTETFMSMADRISFIKSFEQLTDPPEDLADLEFVIKSHPRSDLSSFFQHLHFPANMRIVDPKASLFELTKRAWAIAMFNHFGSATVHAIRAEKPMLFLNSAGLFWPHTEWLAFPAGEVVGDVSSIWNLLRRLKKSPQFYQQLREKCQKFKLGDLYPAEMTLAQQLRATEAGEAILNTKQGVQTAVSA